MGHYSTRNVDVNPQRHPLLQEAFQVLEKNFDRAVADAKYGAVGVTIKLEKGVPIICKDFVEGTVMSKRS